MRYPLVRDTIRKSDIDSLCEWMKTYPRLSKGPLTLKFEKDWAEWLGTKYAVYVNSGSSANLLALSVLVESGRINRGSKVVVPAVSWATDLSPVMQLGLHPVLCDCNMEDLSLDLDKFEQICKTETPQAVMFVSVLGLVPDMDRVVRICKKYNVALIEDACESFGSEFGGNKVGSFGVMSTFSLYYGHHLSTIEGGIVATDDEEMYNVLLSIRSHGWMRDCSPSFSDEKHEKWKTEDFNKCYTFYYPGFNLRSTDLQAYLGIRQLSYASEVSEVREKNFRSYLDNISSNTWKPKLRKETFVSNFCYPLICSDRSLMSSVLRDYGIETRPLIAGSMSQQPFYVERYGDAETPNADAIHRNGLYIPNNHNMTEADVETISSVVNGVLERS